MAGYGALKVKRVTETTSVGAVMVCGMVVTHKSNVRAVANVRASGTAGRIVVPFDVTGSASVRHTTTVIEPNREVGIMPTSGNSTGAPTRNAYVQMSGASTVGYVYYQDI